MTRLLQSSMKPVLPVSMFGMGLSLRCGGRDALCATEEAGARTEEIVATRRSPGSRVVKHAKRRRQSASTPVKLRPQFPSPRPVPGSADAPDLLQELNRALVTGHTGAENSGGTSSNGMLRSSRPRGVAERNRTTDATLPTIRPRRTARRITRQDSGAASPRPRRARRRGRSTRLRPSRERSAGRQDG